MRFFLLTLTLFLLTACSPKYEIKTHYTPPSDAQGKTCVQSCSNDKRMCQANCNMKYDQCLATAQKGASDAFPSLMNEYQDVLSDYQYAMDRYNLEMDSWTREEQRVHRDFEHYRSTCHKKPKNSYECRRSNELDSQLRSLEDHQPIAPSRPIKPSLASEIKQAQKNCSNRCGCTKSYDNCFGSCGGKLRYEKICIENCK
ncbi:MAG: Unknown protein [uncultured Sulfurovum sp.]|uniref:Lipoprotein n=1 Tax=uncultured Sulfurovum sp. TaxID=269237 RepID=A0A6S6SYI8_9BACT|nr:MAG: Unknown protein [uncultured Sulfurovum sp.]